jgi:hypothetical protein
MACVTGSSEAGRRIARAWACLGANALVLPGLGSIAGGLPISGALQILASLAGFVLTMIWAVSWLGSALEQGTVPTDLGPNLGRGALGLLLFAVSWLWGVASGAWLVRRARNGD